LIGAQDHSGGWEVGAHRPDADGLATDRSGTHDDRRSARPLLLVSVRGGEEARAAVDGGADIIDVKEPSAGPLGRAPLSAALAAAAACRNRPWTLACGELADTSEDEILLHAAALAAGLAGNPLPWGLKVGLARSRHADWRGELAAVVAGLPKGFRMVAVGYADAEEVSAPTAEEVIDAAVPCGGSAILIDTFHKRPGGILQRRGADWLAGLLRRCRATGLPVAVAGGIEKKDLPLLATLAPDIVAVRTAACRGGREGSVETPLVEALRSALRA
jgi:uncharacterized protein (UPF0264 family)